MSLMVALGRLVIGIVTVLSLQFNLIVVMDCSFDIDMHLREKNQRNAEIRQLSLGDNDRTNAYRKVLD